MSGGVWRQKEMPTYYQGCYKSMRLCAPVPGRSKLALYLFLGP